MSLLKTIKFCLTGCMVSGPMLGQLQKNSTFKFKQLKGITYQTQAKSSRR